MGKEVSVQLTLGYKTIKVNFEEDKEPIYIRFNPADDDLPRRLIEAEKMIKSDLEKIDVPAENDAERFAALIDKKNEAIYNAIDYAFGNKISAELFKYCSPTAIVNGELFCQQFFDRIAPVILEIVEKEKNKADTANRKYYKKYKAK